MGRGIKFSGKADLRILRRAAPLAAGTSLCVAGVAALQDQSELSFNNESGISTSVSNSGQVDMTGPFFQDLGTNGRKCVTCHMPNENWTITPAGVKKRFNDTDGLDPIFRLNDGSNSPIANVSTVKARRIAYSMLLNKGLIRVERPIPAGAEFSLVDVNDPYGYASAAGLSLFRRPLPTTNLRFVSTVMWDGREVDPATPMKIANSKSDNEQILFDSLVHQSLTATNGHAEAAQDLTFEQKKAIVDFEMTLATAQKFDSRAGMLGGAGALAGPSGIHALPFYIGINDNVEDPNGPFTADAMRMFGAWKNSSNPFRRSIARGEELFNNKPIQLFGVKGLNDNPYFGSPTSFSGSCTTCHNTPNIGNHSLAVALDIGIADGSRRTPDMPLYTMRNNATDETIQTTDPGLALSTGKWKDIGRFKGPILRSLSGRAPYFHNGSAADLNQVLDFYSDRFGVQFSNQEKIDLIAFLKAL